MQTSAGSGAEISDKEPPIVRTAVITGAGRGIGRGLALGLAAHGFDVALLGRTRAHLDPVAAEIVAAGAVRCLVAETDLTDGAGARVTAARVEADLGGVGLLVNNAGVIERQEVAFAADDADDTWRVIENNLRGPLNITHALLPGMLARGGGRIVNVNSGVAYRSTPTNTGYGISKSALSRMSTLIDAQYRDRGIRIFDLAPGVVLTDMTREMAAHAGRTEWTAIEDVVELLLALASGELDRLSGRLVRAGADTAEELVARTYEILVADARRLRMVPYGPTDPLH